MDCAKVGPAVVTNGCPTKQICVSACPTQYWSGILQYTKELTAEKTGGALSNEVRTEGRKNMICEKGGATLTLFIHISD